MRRRRGMIPVLAMLVSLVMIVSLIVGCGGEDDSGKKTDLDQENTSTTQTGQKLEFTDFGRFGFLSGGQDREFAETLEEIGIGWLRPHPGPFVWGSMQEDEDEPIDFNMTDELVTQVQEEGFDLLITIWPYAEWDQLDRPDADAYKVPPGDEFLPDLPPYRGNPVDWEAYEEWLNAVVERYDGDGKDDMEGLRYPVRYWEISNEPDINYVEESHLNFYMGDPAGYAELLRNSYKTIKAADSESQVLIAGAAGGQAEFMEFWQTLFAIPDVRGSFDIGNVHCISGGHVEDFNVSPYKSALESAGIDKPIWVTEAENVSKNAPETNPARLESSVREAFDAGAEKIFFTGASMSGEQMKYREETVQNEKEIYKNIVSQYP